MESNHWAYVVMPEHVHLLIMPQRESHVIARICRRMKEPVSRRVLDEWSGECPDRLDPPRRADLTNGQVPRRFRQPGGGYDRNLHNPDAIERAIDYIEWNPVRRGLVADPLHWTWSSARARVGETDVPLRIDPVSGAQPEQPVNG